MSTFCGHITEIPYISVDRFEEHNKNAEMFFLSHCHTDHMRGLDDRTLRNKLFGNFKVILYASSISVRILKNKYADIALQLKELSLDAPKSLKAPSNFNDEESLTVTIIPAGHCPGSVMFLFETKNKTVLYTGDFRIDPKDLHKYKIFHNKFGDVKQMDNVYLDTTFCNLLYKNFSSREDSTQEMCKLVEEWLAMSDHHIINVSLSAYYGLEYLFIELFKRTNKSIHVLDRVYDLYKYIPDMSKVITRNMEEAKIHTSIQFNSCCDVRRNSNYFVRYIKPSAIVWDNYDATQSIVRQESETDYRICYSSHSSFNEIRDFVRYLKPSHIEPCVVPEDLQEKEELFALLSEMCNEYKINKDDNQACEKKLFSTEIAVSNAEVRFTDSSEKLNLLSSPPRNFKRKRLKSDS